MTKKNNDLNFIEPRIDRIEIAKIILNNIELLKKNNQIAYELADCILVYFVTKKEKKNDKK